jgi:hypothetical protein
MKHIKIILEFGKYLYKKITQLIIRIHFPVRNLYVIECRINYTNVYNIK